MTDYYCTLAKTWNPDKQDVRGWYWSEKLDGVRALWKPELGCFMSRSNKPLNVPPSWLDMMSEAKAHLDGEFFMGRGRFQDTVSAVRKKVPTEADFEGVQYVVFDAITSNEDAPFMTRLIHAEGITHKMHDSRIVTLQHQIVGTMGDMGVHYLAILASGGEGIMFRNSHMKYEFKRSSNLLKWKSNIDGKAVVTSIQLGEGKHEGRMGALLVMDIETDVRFKIGTGFTDEERQWWFDIDPKGKQIRWRAMERTRDGVPRFPVFVCIDEGD